MIALQAPANERVYIGLLALVGSVKFTWLFSAFTVLVYYAITNLAGLRLPPDQRRFPRWWRGRGWWCVRCWRSG